MRVFPPFRSVPWGLGFGALALATLSACAPAIAQSLPEPTPQQETAEGGTLQVTGQARVQIPADQVTISFAVETESPTARVASSENAEKMGSVVAALKDAGGEAVVIETFGYALMPQYRRTTQDDPSAQTISAYRAMNNIRVTLDDVERAGEILDVGITAGANRVMNLQFSATETREARQEALREAVRLARAEAQTIAEAMEVRLGPALEVQVGAAPRGSGIFYATARAMEASARPTPIEAGEQDVSATVTITYRILEGGH